MHCNQPAGEAGSLELATPERDAVVEALLGHLPYPLALVGPSGAVQFTNEPFARDFDLDAMKAFRFQHTGNGSDEPRLAWLTDRGGCNIAARVLGIEAWGAYLLIADQQPDAERDSAVTALRARIAELEAQTSTDCLTGAWNRTHFNKAVEVELDRSLRYKQPLSLILLDIDHFKQVNDRHGHPAGDAVLRGFASVVAENIRASDMLFRWGGEEFAVLATATGHRGAWTLAELLRTKIAQAVFPAAGRLTASLGVAEHHAGEIVSDWFKRADVALYQAKHNGRNQTCISQIGNSDRWAAQRGLAAVQLVWQEAYECGEPTIDREHRELFGLANDLIVAAFSGKDSGRATTGALDALIEHLAAHFRDEEALLEKHAYPRLDTHRRAHHALLNRGLRIRRAVDSGEETFGDLVEFLANEVVARHLFKMDRDFFPLFGNA